MTTDSDRISRIEGIIEQISLRLTALEVGQESLRAEMRESIGSLRAEMHESNGSLRAEIGSLRIEMQNQTRMVLLTVVGASGAVFAGMCAAIVTFILQT